MGVGAGFVGEVGQAGAMPKRTIVIPAELSKFGDAIEKVLKQMRDFEALAAKDGEPVDFSAFERAVDGPLEEAKLVAEGASTTRHRRRASLRRRQTVRASRSVRGGVLHERRAGDVGAEPLPRLR